MHSVDEQLQQQLLTRYGQPPYTIMRRLTDGGDVVGDGVTADNRLVYVIKRGEAISVEYAENQPVIVVQRPTMSRAATPRTS